MCLVIKDINDMFVTDKDIEAYKVFKVSNGKLFSPYINMEVELGKTYTDEGEVKPTYNAFTEVTAIEDGMFHFFTNEGTAKNFAMWICNVKSADCLVVKCIIPKGTKVIYEHKASGINNEMCAKTYTPKEIIKRVKPSWPFLAR